jgi:hypothetical protein
MLLVSVIAGLLLSGCVATWSDEPLAQPGTGRYDVRMLGNWYSGPHEEGDKDEYLYLHLSATRSDRLDWFAVVNSPAGVKEHVVRCNGTAFPTTIANKTYLSVKLQACRSPGGAENKDFPAYIIVLVTVSDNDLLAIRFLSREKLLALEASGGVHLRKEGAWPPNIFVETPGPELAALIQRLGPEGIFEAGPKFTFIRFKPAVASTQSGEGSALSREGGILRDEALNAVLKLRRGRPRTERS